ncbi:MAG: type II toxin-antitoxin system RelE/ParE family toxin [Isosphaeraceae bacterium]
MTDLETIVTHIAQTDLRAAEKLGNAILDHIEVLRTFPRIGPRYAKARRGQIRQILSGKYRIMYRVDEQLKSVEILTILHGAREEPEFN